MQIFQGRNFCLILKSLVCGRMRGKMETKVKKINREALCKEDFAEAVKILKQGGLVAFPTETVYGLGGDALDAEAAAKIYSAKGRPLDNPLIVHIADKEDIYQLAEDIPDAARKLADKFWPGPLTIILKKGQLVPNSTTGGLATVAIRMPSDQIAAMLIRESGLYIAAPSANASGRPSTTRAEHVYEDLAGRIPLILDGGPVPIGLESTIVDLSGEHPIILRPGYITLEQLKEILPDVVYDRAVISRHQDVNIVAKAPGMKYRHYAPKGSITIYEGTEDAVVSAINQQAKEKIEQGYRVAVLSASETSGRYQYGLVKNAGARCKEQQIAANLFEVLREFDEEKIEFIYAESFDTAQLGQAIMNRLLKAAGYHIVRV